MTKKFSVYLSLRQCCTPILGDLIGQFVRCSNRCTESRKNISSTPTRKWSSVASEGCHHSSVAESCSRSLLPVRFAATSVNGGRDG